MMTGKPISPAMAFASPGSVMHSLAPGTTGTPAFTISHLAATLSPMSASTLVDGPMNLSPSRSQAAAKLGFSARKP